MARKTATAKATGGGGYTFADKVAAGFLVQILEGRVAFHAPAGVPDALDFETRDSGHILDDLLLVIRAGGAPGRVAISIKSGRELTTSGFSTDFVQDAWGEWQRSDFKVGSDLLMLVVGAVSDRVLEHWQRLEEQATRTTPERLVARLADERQSSGIQRAIFASLRRTQIEPRRDAIECAQLLSHLRVLQFSPERQAALSQACQSLVVEATVEEGRNLWNRLLELASTNRGAGGHIDAVTLRQHLRGHFHLREQPDVEADWSQIAGLASENIRAVRSVIGSNIAIAREAEESALSTAVEASRVVAVIGESGSGKSAVVAKFVSNRDFDVCLWLSSEQLSSSSQSELARSLGLRNTLPWLVARSTATNCVLVLDGFEQFEGGARLRATELLQAIGAKAPTTWKIVVTCQARYWETAQDALIAGGVTDLKEVAFDMPSVQQIITSLHDLPAVQTLLVRNDLQPILRNLVVLDWVVKGNIAERFSGSPTWIGDTQLIAYIWTRWIGHGPKRFAREHLLHLLGESEGERLSGAVHRDSVPHDQLQLLGELADDDLVRVNGPSVRFAHDLIGDWARFHVLLFAGDAASQRIKAVSATPRWGRAIRLFAQSLAEQHGGLTQWKSLSLQLAGDDTVSQLAQDLLLDGLTFAANSEHLLEQVWADLIADDGAILRRLLKRLMHVASVPDWRIALLREGADLDQLAAWFRVPLPVYWYPALRVLSRHAQDVASHALRDAAEACVLWLQHMPVGMPGRMDASRLATAIGREAQARLAEGAYFTDESRVIFEALLMAAPELPDDIGQIVLELSERRPQPEHATQRRHALRVREAKLRAEWNRRNPQPRPRPTGMFPGRSLGELRPQAADGPRRAVSDGFQSAVLDGLGLQPLIRIRPSVAKEVLLAVCIEEPTRVDPYNRDPFMLRRHGLASWRRGYPALYWKGPFLAFLQQQPAEGLDAIVRLVNFATDQWLEAVAGPGAAEAVPAQFQLEFVDSARTHKWIGDGNVFGWHRSMSLDASAVECALMAVEKWLYDEVDAGHEISHWIDFIFEHGRSLAFAGVLLSVGLKRPGLFTRELQPLLSNFYVYRWQLHWAVSEQQEVWAIALSNLDRQLMPHAIEWHRMPHRRSLLQDLAPWLMLQDEGTATLLARCRPTWQDIRDSLSGDRKTIDVFLARFDPANYTKTPQSDGQIRVELHLPKHLETEIQRAQEGSALKMLSLTLAGRSRRLLRGQERLESEDVGAFAADVQRLEQWEPDDLDTSEQRYRINSIAGGIAVLVVEHREWLSRHPDTEQWCLDVVRTLRPTYEEHDSTHSAIDYAAESFLGEIGVALLCEREDEWVLRLALNGIAGFYYNSPWLVMWRACVVRDRLGPRFDELVNAVVVWCALRPAAHRESGHFDDDAVLSRYRDALFRRLLLGRLKGAMIPLRRVELLGRRLLARVARKSMTAGERIMRDARRDRRLRHVEERKLSREIPDIDTEVLWRGLGFLPRLMRQPIEGDALRASHIVRELCDFELRMLSLGEPDGGDWEIDGTPYEFETWILEQVAELMAHTPSIEANRAYYRPILALGPAAAHWVEHFLQAWIRIGLDVANDPVAFKACWEDMVRYAMGLQRWRPRDPRVWNPAETISVDLMGLRKDAAKVLGLERHLDVIRSMEPTFDEWEGNWLGHAMPAAWFAHFLTTESGRILIPNGIVRFAKVVGSFADRDWHHHNLGVLLTQVLGRCWTLLRTDVETQPEFRAAFLELLTYLCVRQVPEALHLRTKVSAALGGA
jgi:hypothetical protein